MTTGGNLTTGKSGRGSANFKQMQSKCCQQVVVYSQTTVENYDGTSWTTLPKFSCCNKLY